jgi:hypothetical protein
MQGIDKNIPVRWNRKCVKSSRWPNVNQMYSTCRFFMQNSTSMDCEVHEPIAAHFALQSASRSAQLWRTLAASACLVCSTSGTTQQWNIFLNVSIYNIYICICISLSHLYIHIYIYVSLSLSSIHTYIYIYILDDGWPESVEKHSERCKYEDFIAWNINIEIYDDA